MVVRRVVAALLMVGLSAGPVSEACGQSPPSPGPATPSRTEQAPAQAPQRTAPGVDVDELPISVDRIGRRLSNPSPISLELSQPIFRTEVVESRPTWLGDIEWLPDADARLPVPSGPASHREFLTMVTPQQARPFGQVQGWDLLQLVASSFAQGVATNMVAGKIKRAAERRRAAEVRAEVDAAIEAWKHERERAATNPPSTVPESADSETSPPR
jgi:hypothetical protein